MKITIYQLLLIPIFAFTLLSANCQKTTTSTTSADATIEINVMSRGAYQYLIKIEDKAYLSENLPSEFQKDKMKVTLEYKILNEKGAVYKPGPTDIPQEDYQVDMIDIVKIRQQ